MGLAPIEGMSPRVSPGLRSEMVMMLLFSDIGTLSTLLLRWSAGCSLDPFGFSIVNLWLCDKRAKIASRSTGRSRSTCWSFL